MSHPWKSSGEKRTIWWYYEPSEKIMHYLYDMRDAVGYALLEAERLRKKNEKMPSSIDLRKEIKTWFNSSYDYAKHYINPVCRTAVTILRSFRKNSKGKTYPEVKKLAMRIDSELAKIVDNKIRITIRPGEYEFIPVNNNSKKWNEYSKYRISEILVTDSIVSISFTMSEQKPLSKELIGVDLNFKTVDLTSINLATGDISGIETISVTNIVKIQNDFSRQRQKIQKHVRNPQKRNRKLKQTRGRQRRRIKDALHKQSVKVVRGHPESSFVFEDLKGIRSNGENKGKKFRTYLNRWPYAEFQKMIEYKSPNKTIKMNPGGTSSECPVCGGKVKHPTWKISRCETCGRDYDRDRLASLAITLRGLALCGDPFPVSAESSLPSVMNEYLYTRNRPVIPEAGRTEMAYVPN